MRLPMVRQMNTNVLILPTIGSALADLDLLLEVGISGYSDSIFTVLIIYNTQVNVR